jgi:EmrB/QacA subfamily drug resistance transporter
MIQEARMGNRPVNLWAVLITVSLGFFMTLLDLTIVNIAIPRIIDGLSASFDQILWIVNAYTLVLATLLIATGRLGDIIGQRNAFVAGVALFTAASACCGFAPSAAWLIAFRALQGLAAAIMMPQTLTILTLVFPADRRGLAFGVWGGVAGLATVAGPTVGGLLVTLLGWRYIFFVNLPVGAVVVVLAMIFVPALRGGAKHHFDPVGVVTGSAGLLAICYGLIEGQRYDWGRVSGFVSIPLILASGLCLLAVFGWQESRSGVAEALIPWRALGSRDFYLANLISACAPIGIIGVLLPFTIYLQSVLGYSAVKAGLVMAPASVVSMFVAPVAGRLADRVGGKFVLLAGLLFFSTGVVIVAVAASTISGPLDFLPGLVIAGVGIGCTFAPLITVAMKGVSAAMAGAASGVFNTSRQVGTVIGTAGIGALLANRLTSAWSSQVNSLSHTTPVLVRHSIEARFASLTRGGLNLSQLASVRLTSGAGSVIARIFSAGFATGMRMTMIAGAGVLLLAAVLALALAPARKTSASATTASNPSEPPAELV